MAQPEFSLADAEAAGNGRVETSTCGSKSRNPDLIAMLQALAEPLARALGPGNEVVVHDLALIPDSIVAISGDVTGRSVGGPTTDLLLLCMRQGQTDDLLRYRSTTPGGAPLISSTIFLNDLSGRPIASLCINTDQTPWLQIKSVLNAFTEVPAFRESASVAPLRTDGDSTETFAGTVEALTAGLVDKAIRGTGIPVDLMQRQHKLEVVRHLESAGVFLIRDAVDYVALALQVSRYTIYNYLSELRKSAPTGRRAGRRATSKRLPLRTVSRTVHTSGDAPAAHEQLIECSNG